MSHTPGPWDVLTVNGVQIVGNAKLMICVCLSPCPPLVDGTAAWKDNGPLIAAAPDLLAACQAVLMLRSLGGMMPGVREVVMVAVEEAEKAIQKATGEESKC